MGVIVGKFYRWVNTEGWVEELLGDKFSKGYPLKVMAVADGWVIAAFPHCTPLVFVEKDFLEKFEPIEIDKKSWQQ